MAKIQDLRRITPRTNGTRSIGYVRNIARHHSATTDGDWYSFWKYWNGVKGWGTGGYAEIILRDGTVQLCYDPHEITNGVGGHNDRIYNICLVGNGSFTAAQEKAWNERALNAMKIFNLPVSAVLGHNEFSGTNTSCPGIDMNIVRKALKQYQDGGSSQPTAPTNNGESIVDYLKSKGLDSSYNARAKLAAEYGIKNYSGSPEQNVKLLELVKKGKPATAPKTEKKEVNTLNKSIVVINSTDDFPAASRLASRLNCAVVKRSVAERVQLGEKIYVCGGNTKGLKGSNFVDLSGATYFDTAAKIENHINKL